MTVILRGSLTRGKPRRVPATALQRAADGALRADDSDHQIVGIVSTDVGRRSPAVRIALPVVDPAARQGLPGGDGPVGRA